LGGFAIGARVALLWQHNANPSYNASIPHYNDIVRTLGGVCARCWPVTGGRRGRSQNCAPYIGSARGWLAGDWPSTGSVLNITAAAWTAGFPLVTFWQHTRMQNVSEYMLVLALCLVVFVDNGLLNWQKLIQHLRHGVIEEGCLPYFDT